MSCYFPLVNDACLWFAWNILHKFTKILVHWLVSLMLLNIIRTKMAKYDPKSSLKFRNKYLRCKSNETSILNIRYRVK